MSETEKERIITEETKNEKKGDFLSRIDKIKKADTKKIIKIISIVCFLVTVVIMTVTNFAIDKNFNLIIWISNSCILAGIMVFGLLMGESLGGDKQKEKPKGLYQNALSNFNSFMATIADKIVYFTQWFNWFMPQELFNKKKQFLIQNGLDPNKAENIIKYCEYTDIEALSLHPVEKVDDKGNKILIRKIEAHQIELIKYVLNGEIKLNVSNASYYLTAVGNSGKGSVLERGSQLDKMISFNKKGNRIKKIVVSLGISLILGLFAVEQVMGAEQASAWVNLISRITALFTSLASGWASSITDVRLKAEKIENKTTVLRLFFYSLKNNEFKPMSEQELAEQELKEWKEKEEEAKKNVVIPEVISKREPLKLDDMLSKIPLKNT